MKCLKYFSLLLLTSFPASHLSAQSSVECDDDLVVYVQPTKLRQESAENYAIYQDLLVSIKNMLEVALSSEGIEHTSMANYSGATELLPTLAIPNPLLQETHYQLILKSHTRNANNNGKATILDLGKDSKYWRDSIIQQKHLVLGLFCEIIDIYKKIDAIILDGHDLRPFIFPERKRESGSSSAVKFEFGKNETLRVKKKPEDSKNDTFRILLFPFDYYSRCDDDLSAGCVKAVSNLLKKESFENDINMDIKICYAFNTQEKPLDYGTAKKIALLTNADFLIWGDYEKQCDWDSTVINCKYYAAREDILNQLQGELRETGPAPVKDMRSIVTQQDIAGNIKDVVYFLMAKTTKDTKKARLLFEKISIPKDKNEYIPVWVGLANIAANKEERMRYSLQAIALDSTNYLALANICPQVEKKERHRRYLQIKQYHPNLYWPKEGRSHAEFLYSNAMYKLALSTATEVINQHQDTSSRLFLIRGCANYSLHLYQEAIDDFMQYKTKSGNDNYDEYLAMAYSGKGMLNEAEDIYMRLVFKDNSGALNHAKNLIIFHKRKTRDTTALLMVYDSLFKRGMDHPDFDHKQSGEKYILDDKIDVLINLKEYNWALKFLDSLWIKRTIYGLHDYENYFSKKLDILHHLKEIDQYEATLSYYFFFLDNWDSWRDVSKVEEKYGLNMIFNGHYNQVAKNIEEKKRVRDKRSKRYLTAILRRGQFYAFVGNKEKSMRDFEEIITSNDTIAATAHLELAKIAADSMCFNEHLVIHHCREAASWHRSPNRTWIGSKTWRMSMLLLQSSVGSKANSWALNQTLLNELPTFFPEDSLYFPKIFTSRFRMYIARCPQNEKVQFIQKLISEKKYLSEENREEYNSLNKELIRCLMEQDAANKKQCWKVLETFLDTYNNLHKGEEDLADRYTYLRKDRDFKDLVDDPIFDKILKKYQKKAEKMKR